MNCEQAYVALFVFRKLRINIVINQKLDVMLKKLKSCAVYGKIVLMVMLICL